VCHNHGDILLSVFDVSRYRYRKEVCQDIERCCNVTCVVCDWDGKSRTLRHLPWTVILCRMDLHAVAVTGAYPYCLDVFLSLFCMLVAYKFLRPRPSMEWWAEGKVGYSEYHTDMYK